MATLEKIRGHAPLLVTIVGLALLGFIIEDFLNSGSTYFRQSKNQVVTVNGTSVDYQEYQKRIEEMTEVTKLQYGLQSLNEEQTPSDELFDMIQGDNIPPIVQQNPLFLDPQTRRFNKARALGVLKALENIDAVPEEQREEMQQMRNFWLFWEKNMKLQRMQEKYMNLLTKAIVANPIDAKDAYEGSVVSSDIVYAVDFTVHPRGVHVETFHADGVGMYKERVALREVLGYRSGLPAEGDGRRVRVVQIVA